MRTLDALHRPAALSKELGPCPVCGRHLPPGRRKYCSEACRWSEDENARQALHRLSRHLERLDAAATEMLALAEKIEKRPSRRSAREEHVAHELGDIDATILRQGLSEGSIRSDVWLRASVICLDFRSARPETRGELLEYARSLEILRDVGIVGSGSISKIRQYGWEAVLIYRQLRAFPALVRAMIAYGNPCRQVHEEQTTRKMIRAAWHIVNEKCNLNEPNVPVLRHNVSLWNLRYFGLEWSREKQSRVCAEVLDLVKMTQSPNTRLETHRELAAFWNNNGETEKALEQCAELDRVLAQNAFPDYGKSSLGRPRIEILKRLGRKDELVERIEAYRSLYERDRNVHHFDQLARWKKELGLGFELCQPEYFSGVLTYLPRSEMR